MGRCFEVMMLELKGVAKSFGGTQVLQPTTLRVE